MIHNTLQLFRPKTILLFTMAILLGGLAFAIPPIFLLAIVAFILIFISTISSSTLSILLFLLVLAPLRTLIATEAPLPLPLDIGQILLIIYVSMWLARRIYSKYPILNDNELYSSPLLIVSGVIVLIFGLNIWAASSIGNWLSEWLKWCIIAFLIWQLQMDFKWNWHWLIYAFLISAVANALVGIYIFLGGSGADHLIILNRFFRAFGTFGQPNPFGGFMGIALPISIMLTYTQLLQNWHFFRKNSRLSIAPILSLILTSLISIILFAALITSWSRGAWLGFIVSALVIVIAIPHRVKYSILMVFTLTIIIISALLVDLIPQAIITRLTTAATDFITIEEIRGVDITTVNYAVVERIAHWQAAINMAEANSLFGVGLGNYEVVYHDYRLINWEEPLGHAHNYYLNILAEAGIIGSLAFIGFWAVVFYLTWTLRQHPDNFTRSIVIGLLGSWTYIAIHSLFDNLYVNNLFLHIGLLLGILAILYRQFQTALILE